MTHHVSKSTTYLRFCGIVVEKERDNNNDNYHSCDRTRTGRTALLLDAEMVIDGVLTSVAVCEGTLPEIAEWISTVVLEY